MTWTLRRKSNWEQRDDAIDKASDLIHRAIAELRQASNCAARMLDEEMATALWNLSDELPIVTREIDAHLSPSWRAHVDKPRLPVRSLSRPAKYE